MIKNIKISQKSLRKILQVNEYLYLSGSEGIIWKLNHELEIEKEINAGTQTIFALAFHNEGDLLLSGGRDAVLKLWKNMEEVRDDKCPLVPYQSYCLQHVAAVLYNLQHG